MIDTLQTWYPRIDKYTTLEARIEALEAKLADLSIKQADQPCLEERTEPPISGDKPIIPQFKDYKQGQAIRPEDLEAYRAYRESFTTDATCQGDKLGQCEHGCDGVSDRGSCMEDAMYNQAVAGGKSNFVYAAIGKMLGLSPVDNVQSCNIEDEDRERTATRARLRKWADDVAVKDEAKDSDMDMPTCPHCGNDLNPVPGRVRKYCTICLKQLRDDSSVAYNNKPRSEPVDSDDVSIADGVDSRSGGSTEGKDSEQKANMSDKRAKGRVLGLSDGVSCDCFTLGLRHVAPIQVVYCMGGARYEAQR